MSASGQAVTARTPASSATATQHSAQIVALLQRLVQRLVYRSGSKQQKQSTDRLVEYALKVLGSRLQPTQQKDVQSLSDEVVRHCNAAQGAHSSTRLSFDRSDRFAFL